MTRVPDRSAKATIPFNSQRLARESEAEAEFEELELDIEVDLAPAPPSHPRVVPLPLQPPRGAVGTTPPEGHDIRPRTVTVHDPFTTSVLAEVARRTRTVETEPLSAEQAAAEEFEHEPDDLTPVTSPGFTLPRP
jgi:hypothetical protein